MVLLVDHTGICKFYNERSLLPISIWTKFP